MSARPFKLSCVCGTFCQLPSTFRVSAGPSVNFLYVCRNFRQLPSTFCASNGTSINFPYVCWTFRQLYVRPQDLRQLSVWPWDFPSISVILLCVCGTFCLLSVHPNYHPLTFRASAGPSVNFLCGRGTFRQLQSTFRVASGPPSTFCAAAGLSITFRAFEGPSVNFCQLSLHQRDLSSIFMNFMCIR